MLLKKLAPSHPRYKQDINRPRYKQDIKHPRYKRGRETGQI